MGIEPGEHRQKYQGCQLVVVYDLCFGNSFGTIPHRFQGFGLHLHITLGRPDILVPEKAPQDFYIGAGIDGLGAKGVLGPLIAVDFYPRSFCSPGPSLPSKFPVEGLAPMGEHRAAKAPWEFF